LAAEDYQIYSGRSPTVRETSSSEYCFNYLINVLPQDTCFHYFITH